MKQIKYIVALMFSAFFTTSCVDTIKVGDAFLEKAPGVDVNIDTIFSKAEYVRNFLWSAYGQLYCTYRNADMMNGAPIDALSDCYQCYCGYGGPYKVYYPGLVTEDSQDNPDGNVQCRFSYSTKNPGGSDGDSTNDGDGRVSIYETVRKCWLLIENIDKVPGMDTAEKERLKGEAYTIMASRYFDAFRNFGGLCLVDHAYAVGEEFTTGRSTAWETVEFIDGLIQKALEQNGFIWNVANEDVGQWTGRLTRASAKALRCKLWMHAASPLFNNAEPYMRYEGAKKTELTNELHVWFGKEDPTLWQRCLDACNDFFADNENNGNFYQLIQPETKDEAGYRMAYRNAYRYRNTETNHEKLFDVHVTTTMSQGGWGWGHTGFYLDGIRNGAQSPTAELTECFGMADGTNYPYLEMDIWGPGKNKDGIDIFENRDPRLYETVAVPRHEFPAGVVGDYCGNDWIDSWVNGITVQDGNLFNAEDNLSGLKRFKWFLDHSWEKMDDKAIGVSYIRLAEVYLIKAEALAELGRNKEAIEQVNVVRARVGLDDINKKNPKLNLLSNKENLINEILRERCCEIGAECGDRFYDMIRRKRQDLFTKQLHNLLTYRLNADGTRNMEANTTYEKGDPWPKFEYDRTPITVGARRWWEPGYWTNKWYLDPVSRTEIQKGYGLTQNPGW